MECATILSKLVNFSTVLYFVKSASAKNSVRKSNLRPTGLDNFDLSVLTVQL